MAFASTAHSGRRLECLFWTAGRQVSGSGVPPGAKRGRGDSSEDDSGGGAGGGEEEEAPLQPGSPPPPLTDSVVQQQRSCFRLCSALLQPTCTSQNPLHRRLIFLSSFCLVEPSAESHLTFHLIRLDKQPFLSLSDLPETPPCRSVFSHLPLLCCSL